MFINDKRIKLQKKTEQSTLLLSLINLLLRKPNFYPTIIENKQEKKKHYIDRKTFQQTIIQSLFNRNQTELQMQYQLLQDTIQASRTKIASKDKKGKEDWYDE